MPYVEADGTAFAMADLHKPSTSDSSIADHVHAALECFRLLLSKSVELAEEDDIRDKETVFNALKESYGRFRVWSGNIAGHRRDKTSLDYRLRGSLQIKLNIIKLLEDLRELLREGRDHFLSLSQVLYNLPSRKPPKALIPSILSVRLHLIKTLIFRSSQDHYQWPGLALNTEPKRKNRSRDSILVKCFDEYSTME